MTHVGGQVRHAWDTRSAPLTGHVIDHLDDERWVVLWDKPSGIMSAVAAEEIVDLPPSAAAQPAGV